MIIDKFSLRLWICCVAGMAAILIIAAVRGAEATGQTSVTVNAKQSEVAAWFRNNPREVEEASGKTVVSVKGKAPEPVSIRVSKQPTRRRLYDWTSKTSETVDKHGVITFTTRLTEIHAGRGLRDVFSQVTIEPLDGNRTRVILRGLCTVDRVPYGEIKDEIDAELLALKSCIEKKFGVTK